MRKRQAERSENGYRNGQLLITTTCGSGYGDPPVLHDNPLVVGETTVQARHITELRTAINTLRAREGMAAYSWTTSATTSDWIKADPILETRTALDQVLGSPPSGYSSGLASGQPIKAVHIQELRDRLTAAWSVDIRWLVSDQLGTPRMIFDASRRRSLAQPALPPIPEVVHIILQNARNFHCRHLAGGGEFSNVAASM